MSLPLDRLPFEWPGSGTRSMFTTGDGIELLWRPRSGFEQDIRRYHIVSSGGNHMALQICLHCHRFIELVKEVWVHRFTGLALCNNDSLTAAEPAPEMEGKWDGNG